MTSFAFSDVIMEKAPIHISKSCKKNNFVALAAGSSLALASRIDGNILFTMDLEAMIVDFQWTETHFIILLDSKHIQFYDIIRKEDASIELALEYSIIIPKRANSLLIDPSNGSAIVGDKFGDVVRYTSGSKNGRLLLGHVSIITDLIWGHENRYLITSDRDEKIRVNNYPNTYNIEMFLLGHKEFVSRMTLIPDSSLLVSGGGDPYLIVWEYQSGSIKQKVEICNDSTGILIEEKSCVTNLQTSICGKYLAVSMESYLISL